MTGPERMFSWWDREIDSAGRPIRADVRLAAHEIWEGACHRTQAVLADHTHAADLMESSVTQVSRYLDYRAVPLSSRKMNALRVSCVVQDDRIDDFITCKLSGYATPAAADLPRGIEPRPYSRCADWHRKLSRRYRGYGVRSQLQEH